MGRDAYAQRELAFLLILACLFAGCAAPIRHGVTISSIRSASNDGGSQRTYVLLPGKEGVTPNDLEFLEYARYVERALADKGYIRTDDSLTAALAVSLYYDVNSTQHPYAYTTPVYGQTGGGIANFGTNTYSPYGNSYTSGTVVQQPTYGVVGSQLHSGVVTAFHRRIWIFGYDVDERDGEKRLSPRWQTKISSSGNGGDMRELFPILIAAASESISTNTKKEFRVTINETDPRIRWIKGLSPKPRVRR